jgi:surfactin synthase thioesterase subunit
MTRSGSERWIVRSPAPNAASRLVCFPYAGGGPAAFRPWAAEPPGGIEVCCVHLPGRESRLAEEPLRRFGPAVAAVVEALDAVEPPFSFFGHSLGALIAFEVTRALAARGLAGPTHLVVAGCHAPHLPTRRPWLHPLADTEFLERIRGLGGTPPEVLENDELMSLLLPALRVDFELYETYRYEGGESLSIPILALAGSDDPTTAPGAVAVWAEHTAAPFAFRVVPGEHFFPFTERRLVLASIERFVAASGAAAVASSRSPRPTAAAVGGRPVVATTQGDRDD